MKALFKRCVEIHFRHWQTFLIFSFVVFMGLRVWPGFFTPVVVSGVICAVGSALASFDRKLSGFFKRFSVPVAKVLLLLCLFAIFEVLSMLLLYLWFIAIAFRHTEYFLFVREGSLSLIGVLGALIWWLLADAITGKYLGTKTMVTLRSIRRSVVVVFRYSNSLIRGI
ncbi:hypothetical protein A6E01_19520 (plasmid) [Vibrio breoganii]|uniref:Uncharacterized protein n=1 Tax=Vibrio breoganii TaxID=553239 RepID=A0AAN1CUP1_9VIBR|nr:hypothetical protein A6E01_19520 [Vibrio breoganii]